MDLVLQKDGNSLLLQCGQWRTWKVGVMAIRELHGVMTDRKAHGAIIVTSGIFTQEARAFAAGKPIDLIEGEQLAGLVREAQDAALPRPMGISGSSLQSQGRSPRCG